MRRALLILLAIVILLPLAAVILVPLFVDKDKVLELASATIKEQTGATLTVGGETDLSIFPTIGITLVDAAITLPEKSEPDIHVGLLKIGVQFMPLLAGEVQIDTFILDGLDVKIEMAEKENAVNTSTMSDTQLDDYYAQRRRDNEAAGEAASAEAALTAPLALNINQLTITNAKVELIDPEGAPSTHIELVELQAKGLNLDGNAIPLSVNLRLPGEQPMEITLDTSLSIDQKTSIATITDLDITVSGATPEPLNVKGQGTFDMLRQVADLNININVSEMNGDGTVRYASYESPQIDANLHFNLLDPALLILAGPEAVEVAAETAPSSGDDPLPLDAIRAIDTKATLTIDQAKFDAHVINNLTVNVRAVDGVLTLRKLTGELHGGKLEAQATFNGKHNVATLDTQGGLTGLDIGTAVAATGSEAALSGTADLTFQLTSKGSTSNELTAAMQGPIELDTQQVVLAGTSVEKLICQAVALTNQQTLTKPFPADTRIETLGAKIQLADGKANLGPLDAKLPQIGLTGGGDFDLLAGDFEMVFKAKLSKGLETLDPACSVSNKLTSIDWPVECKGNTSDDPADWCSVDAQSIIKDLTVNEGKKQIEKEVGKLFNKFLKR